MSEASSPVLSVDSLAVSYGRAVALRAVSLEVHAGRAVALLGPNGAGKSTTIRAITGLLGLHGARVTSGEIRVFGQDVRRRRSDQIAQMGVAHVPEGRMIFAGMSVAENLQLGATARRGGASEDVEGRLLELFPILKRRYRDAGGYLSGGEQQMLAISRALMAEPQLLVLDEVSLGLAPIITRSIFETLAAIRSEFGTAMLVVEQSAKLALEFCEHGYVLETGAVIKAGPSGELAADDTMRSLYLGGAADEQVVRGVGAHDAIDLEELA